MDHISFRNRLLQRMPSHDLALLAPIEPLTVVLHETLHKANANIDYVYFPETAAASVVADQPNGKIEVGLVGDEGMTGVFVMLGSRLSPFETIIQGTGTVLRVSADRLRAACEASPALADLLRLYAEAYHIQVSATSIANGTALLEERLARWLLMVADRQGHSFSITHESLATMLAVRRSGVTLALQLLEGHGLIRSTRGNVNIIDRAGLIERTKGAYGLAEREYERLLGIPLEMAQ